MKPQKNKKLRLNKKTVSRLNDFSMKTVKGGTVHIEPTFTMSLGWPETCWCTANTELWSCCAGCNTPDCKV